MTETLFPDFDDEVAAHEPPIAKAAVLSDDGLYRYELTRQWGAGPVATFVMLNPSTADAMVDDPTIRRCISFARTWGLSGIKVVNQYAWRTKSPAAMFSAERVDGHDIVGPENDDTLHRAFKVAAADAAPVIAAWGTHGSARGDFISVLAHAAGLQLGCLGITAAGSPRHPLYVKGDTLPIRWSPR